MLKRLEYIPFIVTVKPEVVEKKDVPLDNIHDIKAAMRKRAQEKLTAVLHGTAKYKAIIEKQEKEIAYQNRLAEVGAIGMTPDEQKALAASKIYEEEMRAIEQYNPLDEAHNDMAKKFLDAGKVAELESNKEKIKASLIPGTTVEEKTADLIKKTQKQKLPDEK
jgi:hypothetical protein